MQQLAVSIEMHTNRIITGVSVATALACLCYWLINGSDQRVSPSSVKPLPFLSPPTLVPLGNPTNQSEDPGVVDWKRRKQEDRYFEWKMPIRFYGKVVDEMDQPVADAQIRFIWNDVSPTGTSSTVTASNADGRFSLEKVTGKALSVHISKDGYNRSQNQSSGFFEYAAFFEPTYYEPDSGSPVTFRLRKKNSPETLITRQTLYGVLIDGTAHYIDLATGKKSVGSEPTGDIAVRILRPANPDHRFDWSTVIEGVGGAGVLESVDELLFTAPAEGYQSKLEYKQSAKDPTWRDEVQKRIFVRGRDGSLYGLLKADVMAVYNKQGAIDLEVSVNPRRSRNLEPGGFNKVSAR